VDNIRMDLGEAGWCEVEWIGLAQDRNRWRDIVNSVLNLRVSWNVGKLSSGLASSGLSSSVRLASQKDWRTTYTFMRRYSLWIFNILHIYFIHEASHS
jgi:hypothetical protein